jgi:hypothetical protein
VELPQGADRVEIGDLREMDAAELETSADKQLLKAIQVVNKKISGGAGQ